MSPTDAAAVRILPDAYELYHVDISGLRRYAVAARVLYDFVQLKPRELFKQKRGLEDL